MGAFSLGSRATAAAKGAPKAPKAKPAPPRLLSRSVVTSLAKGLDLPTYAKPADVIVSAPAPSFTWEWRRPTAAEFTKQLGKYLPGKSYWMPLLLPPVRALGSRATAPIKSFGSRRSDLASSPVFRGMTTISKDDAGIGADSPTSTASAPSTTLLPTFRPSPGIDLSVPIGLEVRPVTPEEVVVQEHFRVVPKIESKEDLDQLFQQANDRTAATQAESSFPWPYVAGGAAVAVLAGVLLLRR